MNILYFMYFLQLWYVKSMQLFNTKVSFTHKFKKKKNFHLQLC